MAAFAGLPVAFAFTGWLDVFSSGVVVISGLIAFFLLLWLLYRCPQCGELPMTDWEVRGLSANQYLDLDPRECRKCGARLK